jgi:hypothetical protein
MLDDGFGLVQLGLEPQDIAGVVLPEEAVWNAEQRAAGAEPR